MIFAYNKEHVGDVLLVIVADDQGAENQVKRVGDDQPPSAERIVGRKIKVEKSVFSSSTGNTAFSVSAFFLAASYSPSSAAEVKARVSHIFRRF